MEAAQSRRNKWNRLPTTDRMQSLNKSSEDQNQIIKKRSKPIYTQYILQLKKHQEHRNLKLETEENRQQVGIPQRPARILRTKSNHYQAVMKKKASRDQKETQQDPQKSFKHVST
ncbi:Hypothetical predicted protein [Olea europaea subsp. europaea]|uniref:Uncharacterized protein n=1 Tax=Olea europaea subsp. europaea TaxID=158383 RepID=A0A8S0PMK8_OLEEU|nr:Hypothetical predicted protein [Olea europaea subsp. europaea]